MFLVSVYGYVIYGVCVCVYIYIWVKLISVTYNQTAAGYIYSFYN